MTKYVYTYLLLEIGEMGEMDEIVEMVEIGRHFAHFARATSLGKYLLRSFGSFDPILETSKYIWLKVSYLFLC